MATTANPTANIDLTAGLVPAHSAPPAAPPTPPPAKPDSIDLSAGLMPAQAAPAAAAAAPPAAAPAAQPAPGFMARASDQVGLTQHPVDQLISELKRLKEHPIDTLWETVKAPIIGLRDLTYNMTRHPVDTVMAVTHGPEFEKDVKAHNYRGALGTLAGAAAQVGMMKFANPETAVAAMEKLTLPRVFQGEAMTTTNAAEKLTNAVNPPPGDMATFRANLESNLGRIAEHAENHGIELTNREALVKAARGAAEDHQLVYDEHILKPIADKPVRDPQSGIPQGRTYGEAEARLRHLNRTTDYTPTTTAESEAQVARKAEANALREQLNQSMAKELGLQPEQIEEARAAGSQLRDVADKAELAIDIEKHAKNAADRKPLTVNPLAREERFITDPIIEKTMNKLRGHPGDNLVREVFQQLGKVEKQTVRPTAPPPEGTAPPRPTPPWKGKPEGPEMAAPQGSTAAEVQANAKRQSDARFTREASKTASAAVKDENLKTHGNWKAPEAKAPGSTATIGEQVKTKAAAASAKAEFPKSYKAAAQTLDRSGKGGANYTAQQLKDFKKKHGI